ncbi:breast cancer anti-estrogen resistance protein 3 homolog [Glandiceps talaboti]
MLGIYQRSHDSMPPAHTRVSGTTSYTGYGVIPTKMSVTDWLQSLELREYSPILANYPDVQSLFTLTEADFRRLGIRNGAHRARLVSSLVMLKQRHRFSMANQMSPTRGSHGTPLTNQGSPVHRQYYAVPRSPVHSPGAKYEPVIPHRMETPLDVSPEKIKKDLEMELKLENDDIRSHAWFHGCISRDIAEKLLTRNGDFIVRDCISQPGDYVLTMRWNYVLHFIINRVVINPETTAARVQYQFEKESFDSIPALIRYYVGNRKMISQSSQAVISRPVNRTLPLSYTDAKYALTPAQIQMLSEPSGLSPGGSLPNSAPGSPRMPRHQRSGSQPTVLHSPSFLDNTMERSTSQPHMQQRNVTSRTTEFVKDSHKMTRYGSEPLLSPKSERRSFCNDLPPMKQSFGSDSELTVKHNPPPKPSRGSSIRTRERPHSLETGTILDNNTGFEDYSELDQQEPMPVRFSVLRGETCGDDVIDEKMNAPTLKAKLRGRKFSDTRNSILDSEMKDYGYHTFYPISSETITEDSPDVEKKEFIPPTVETESIFKKIDKFSSSLLNEENKPLESTTIVKAKGRLMDADSITLAKYITKEDLKICRIVSEKLSGMSGLELLTLPQGAIFRQDLLERHHCLKFWIAITIMTCLDTSERVRMLTKWIQTAEMLKSTIGNLFGFTAVMEGLCCSQISNLKLTWDMLRQSHTNLAIMFETKLRRVYKDLNSGDSSGVPLTRTSIPHVVPLLQLMERDWSANDSEEFWEATADDYGLDAMLAHIDAARCYAQQSNLYKVTAESKIKGLSVNEELMDCFRTEFHLRILWGLKGAEIDRINRYHKFNQILTAMADRIEPLQTL